MDDLNNTQIETVVQETPMPEPTPPVTEAAPAKVEPTPPVAEPEKPVAVDDKAPVKPDATNELEQTRATMASALDMALKSTVRAAATEAGIKADRIDYAMRLADLSGIDIMAADASEKIAAAIGRVLEDLPELKGAVGVGTGSLGNHARQALSAEDSARADFKRGMNM